MLLEPVRYGVGKGQRRTPLTVRPKETINIYLMVCRCCKDEGKLYIPSKVLQDGCKSPTLGFPMGGRIEIQFKALGVWERGRFLHHGNIMRAVADTTQNWRCLTKLTTNLVFFTSYWCWQIIHLNIYVSDNIKTPPASDQICSLTDFRHHR